MNRRHTLVFYDGNCGLCHGAVRFALNRDPEGRLFRFAPLQGSTLTDVLSQDALSKLADSIAVLGTDDSLWEQSDAILIMLEQIGGGWRFMGQTLSIVPRGLRDLVYRSVARVRHHLFRKPSDMCPVVPASLRERFLP